MQNKIFFSAMLQMASFLKKRRDFLSNFKLEFQGKICILDIDVQGVKAVSRIHTILIYKKILVCKKIFIYKKVLLEDPHL